MTPQRFKQVPWEPDLPFDWPTAGRQLSEEEREIARRLPPIDAKRETEKE